MRAVLHVVLPFHFVVPENASYKTYGFEKDGYTVWFSPPSKSNRVETNKELPDDISVNGIPSFFADVITVNFSKPSFCRDANSEIDPPRELIQYALDMFLSLVKYVSKAPQVKNIEFPLCLWRLRYLDDDGGELQEEVGLTRGRGAAGVNFSYITCDPVFWDLVFNLPENFAPPEWMTLLIDAKGALPHIGSSVVLAFTSLEVLISRILDNLADRSNLPPELWMWINDRGNWQKEPSVEEQYDVLLRLLCGHSLKEIPDLWEALKNLKCARNSFVHDGRAVVGRNKEPVTLNLAKKYVASAVQIVEQIRTWLPADLQWPTPEHRATLEFGIRLMPGRKEKA